jgi:hypothetical protein
VGVSGHGNGWPTSVPKHHIALAEEKQYQAARVRFEQHACP